jgi:hypothetical protein
VTGDSWRELVHSRIIGLNWNSVMADVQPFLAPGADLLTRENLLKVLSRT